MLWLLLAMAVLAGGACQERRATYDVSAIEVRAYRYVIDPKDPLVHAVVEVENTGAETVEKAVVVIKGIGRTGEQRGEQRVVVERLAAGERRCVATSFTNRAQLATIQVCVEPVPEEER
ncbi:MAG: hypothetical protein H5T86_11200 [Armatimonadetes bacterium]|nr:hypothetical protein [Armatimonadota bacterium]